MSFQTKLGEQERLDALHQRMRLERQKVAEQLEAGHDLDASLATRLLIWATEARTGKNPMFISRTGASPRGSAGRRESCSSGARPSNRSSDTSKQTTALAAVISRVRWGTGCLQCCVLRATTPLAAGHDCQEGNGLLVPALFALVRDRRPAAHSSHRGCSGSSPTPSTVLPCSLDCLEIE